ncbi:MAG: hypothetical protein IT326_06995 [Anaerolineae bacterium]|nr:hypothetical protein [Anaerolineae bacterium]
MNQTRRFISTLALLFLTGCAGLPGAAPTPTLFLLPTAGPSLTPPSTVLAVGAPTLTPLPTETPVPSVAPAADPVTCSETSGTVVEAVLQSALTGGEVRYRVYLPPCYATSGLRYPVVVMLHGLGAGMDDTQWHRMGLDVAATEGFVAGSLPPMIIVMPNGNDAQYDYDPGPFPRVIVEDLLPQIEASTCTWNTPTTRAIGGLSRGGYWAYAIAFLNPGLFGRAGAHSGFFYEGDYPQANPYDMARTVTGIDGLVMYLDYGANDNLVNTSVEAFAGRLRGRGLAPELVVNPSGTHNEEYWAAHTADYLEFYARDWPRDLAAFPRCDEPSP